MSLRGQINKINGDFFSAVKNASMKGNVDTEGGMYGTRKIVGYVCKIHTLDDENERLRGTVDVQEFGYEPGEDKYEGVGYHEGVLCSAIQPNKMGVYLMPALYSDVVIVQDPISFDEYVMMYSHVDVIQLQSHTSIKVGVTETEEFDENNEDSPDVDDLKETGNSAISEYSKDGIIHTVKTKDGNITISHKASNISITAKDTTYVVATDGCNEPYDDYENILFCFHALRLWIYLMIELTCRVVMARLPSSESRNCTSSALSWKRFSVSTAGQMVSRVMASDCTQYFSSGTQRFPISPISVAVSVKIRAKRFEFDEAFLLMNTEKPDAVCHLPSAPQFSPSDYEGVSEYL